MNQRRSESIEISPATARRAVRRPQLGVERLESRAMLFSPSLGELPAEYVDGQSPTDDQISVLLSHGTGAEPIVISCTFGIGWGGNPLPDSPGGTLPAPVVEPVPEPLTPTPESEEVPGSGTSLDYFSDWRPPVASINYILTTPTGEKTGLILYVDVYEGEDLGQRLAAGVDPEVLSGKFVVSQVIVEYWKTNEVGSEWSDWWVREGVEVLSPGAAPSRTGLLDSWPSSIPDWLDSGDNDSWTGWTYVWLEMDGLDFQSLWFSANQLSSDYAWLGLAWPGTDPIEADLTDADDTPEACEANVSQLLDEDAVIGSEGFAGLPGAVEVGAAAPAEPAPRSPVAECFAALAGLEPLLSDTVGVPTMRSDSASR